MAYRRQTRRRTASQSASSASGILVPEDVPRASRRNVPAGRGIKLRPKKRIDRKRKRGLNRKHEDRSNRTYGPMKTRAELIDSLNEARRRVETAMDDLIAVASGTDMDLGPRCEAYTESAREFAGLMLCERIHRSFEGTIDQEAGTSNESSDEKRNHAAEIREWLKPWNFGFLDPATGEKMKLLGGANRTLGGAFRLVAYGSNRGGPERSPWPRVRAIVENPILVDVTDSVYRTDSFNKAEDRRR